MGTLQRDVNGFNNRSLQFDGNFRGVYSESSQYPVANSGHLRIADTFSCKAGISANPNMKTSE